MAEYFETSGQYTVCWCGPEGKRVYVAWFKDSPLEYFKTGTEQQRLEAARLLCREHYAQRQLQADDKQGDGKA